MQGGQRHARAQQSASWRIGTVEAGAERTGAGPGYLFCLIRKTHGPCLPGRAGVTRQACSIAVARWTPIVASPRRAAASCRYPGSAHFQRVFAAPTATRLASGTGVFISASDAPINGVATAEHQVAATIWNLASSQALGPLDIKLWYARNGNPSTTIKRLPINGPPIWTPITARDYSPPAILPALRLQPPGFPQRSAAARPGLHLQPTLTWHQAVLQRHRLLPQYARQQRHQC